jgi:tryptophan 2,3-dioxygenase
MPLTYASYLELDRLLSLQSPRSRPPEHDEMLFIITHQTYELWFKEILHELEKIQTDFSGNRLYEAIHTMKRLRTIMKILVAQLDILETMTPMSFTSFRERLDTASGFQSVQFREMEYLLGYKRADMLRYHEQGTDARATLERRRAAPSVVDSFYGFLEARGIALPEALRSRDVTQPNTAHPDLQEGILRLYREDPSAGILFELMTDFDEGFQEWRYRHVMLVARTIGEKHGTGGSLGVEFLKQSLFKPLFADLWAIRHRL